MSLGTWFLVSMPCRARPGTFGIAGNRARRTGGSARGPAHAAVVIGMVGVGLGIAAAPSSSGSCLFSAGFSIEDLRDWPTAGCGAAPLT